MTVASVVIGERLKNVAVAYVKEMERVDYLWR